MSSNTTRPKAVLWNKVFCWSMAITNVALSIGLIWVIQNIDWLLSLLLEGIPKDLPEYTLARDSLFRTLIMACISGGVFSILNIWLAHARDSAAMYYVHLCNLLIGLTTCVCIPLALPLLLAWFKPDVKAHFQVESSGLPRPGR